MPGEELPAIVHELARIVYHAPPSAWRRIRFAVTAEEYEAIRQYGFAHQGWFAAAIRGCPLRIEKQPDNPMHSIESAPAQAK